jgi:glycosyltransferase involved in cell wall biosynthesis
MGLENLIAAIAQVRQSYPDILLYIGGKGAIAATLLAQIEALELQENVQLLGYIPEEKLPVAYRAANFSVVSDHAKLFTHSTNESHYYRI